MNKVKTRALSVYILAAVAVLGMGFYVVRLIISGSEWASTPFNVTAQGRGSIVDRNGVVLADITDGRRTFADNADVRRATLHAVGDSRGNIGTGALVAFASERTGYNFITGSYSLTNTGRQIELTIDSVLNKVALNELRGRRGAVIVSNYLTGDVLCMVSSPTFDPYDPPRNPDREEAPFLNRAIQSAYPPGSTFKLVTVAAAIEQISGIYDRVFICNGELETRLGTITCPGEHGTLGFEQGMLRSCNIVYGELALEMGADIMAEYTRRFKLSESITVGGITTKKGNFDKAPPGSANLAWSGVGQYNNEVCPATMLYFVGAIANDGIAVELQLLRRTGLSAVFSGRTERLLNPSTARQLGDIIEVQNRNIFPGLEMHAKSGTAEVGGGMENHAWYVGYITNENYPLAFVVIVENGGGGFDEASPIASRVLREAIGR